MASLCEKMGWRRIARLVGLATLLWMNGPTAFAATLYVSQDNTLALPPYATWLTAAATIQDAIDASSTGDRIVVTNGVYSTGGYAVHETLTNRVAITKPVTVISVNGPDATVIEGYQVPGSLKGEGAVRCAYLTNGAVLAGFTLRHGSTRTNGTALTQSNGGGVWCESNDSVISNCVFVANVCNFDGGAAYRGTLVDCLLKDNSASMFNEGGGSGGGLAWGVARHCVISNNTSAGIGGAAHAATLTDCVLVGNTLKGRYLWRYDGGGASFCNLTNCTIANNTGSGAYRSTLDQCVVLGNGRGIEESAATRSILSTNIEMGAIYSSVTNCTLAGNLGSGAYVCTLQNCTSTGNVDAGLGGFNSGCIAYNCFITRNGRGVLLYSELHNCVIANNRGVGAWLSTLNNCTVTANIGGVDRCEVNNSIVYYNFSPSGGFENHGTNSTFNYSCTSPLPESGVGNIADEPQLASTSHILANSPCRSAGSSLYVFGTDIDNQAWADPPSMGCDEFHDAAPFEPLSVSVRASFNAVAVGFEVQFTAEFVGVVTSSQWSFGDGATAGTGAFAAHRWSSGGDFPVVVTAYNANFPSGVSATTIVHVVEAPVHYVSAAAANPVAPFTSWETAARTIQDAVDAAFPGGTVLVTNGFYGSGEKVVKGQTNRVAVTVGLQLRSVNGPEFTAIVGQRPDEDVGVSNCCMRCVYLANGATLTGFTLTNGYARWSADDEHDNEDESLDSGGGALCESQQVIISNCVFTANSAHYVGGGVMGGTLINCKLHNNWADVGGAAEESILQNCTLFENFANEVGAANVCEMTGCLVYSNYSQEGGAVNVCSLNNCTVTSNRSFSSYVAGARICRITNSIVWDNYNASHVPSNYDSSTISYSCTLPLPGEGVGNIAGDPRFVNAAAANFHLLPDSPCIDIGLGLGGIVGNDFDGNHRPLDGNRDGIAIFDLGAYEFNGLYFTSVTRAGDKVSLSWYDSPSGLKLQRSTTLSGSIWTDVPTPPGQTNALVPFENTSGFFRLINSQ